ncbi:hypothetical protein QEN19_001368 [Hanseniaspora menglaensis]
MDSIDTATVFEETKLNPDAISKDQNNVIGKFLQLQQKKKQKPENTASTAVAGNEEETGVTAINKYNPYEQDEDEDDEVFDTINRIPIPVLPLHLDYKPRNIKYSYSFNEAYKIQNLAMKNKVLLTKMKQQIPDIGFFRLTANAGNRRQNVENYKPAGNKRKDKRRNSASTKIKTNKKSDANDKTESNLEEKVEMMKLEQEISSTGNKMQDFELFKQMMRNSGEGSKKDSSLERKSNFELSSDSKKSGLTGIFTLSEFDDDKLCELENNKVDSDNNRSNNALEKTETKRGSKYASFLKESRAVSDDIIPKRLTPTQDSTVSSAGSKLMGFFNQRQEDKSPLQQQPFMQNNGYPFNPAMPQRIPNQQHQSNTNFNQIMPAPQFFQQQQSNVQQMPSKNFNPMMPPPQFFHQQQQQQQQPQANNFNQNMNPSPHMMGLPPMPPQFMMMTPQQQQQFFLHQQQQMKNSLNNR